ncbi:MAG: hypothetical protein ACXACG_12035 [Candidatus Thorarchaeota archaeon]|jgi:DNA-binding MarR family transcriptional regulator
MTVLQKGTNRKALLYLLLRGPTIANRILEIQNASRTARRLEKKGLITRTPDKYDFSPQPVTQLSLTVSGLATALQSYLITESGALRLLDRKTLDVVYEIAARWHHLIPEVFGKWILFKDKNVEYIAAERLAYASYSITDPRKDSMILAGHLWSPRTPNINPEEHFKNVFTNFFYDLIYDPTFNRIAYLAEYVQSLRKPKPDFRDSPLIRWVHALKADTDTSKYVENNHRISQAEMKRFEILSSLLGDLSIDTSRLEENLVSVGDVLF